MKSDAIAYVVSGICFGVILGWVIGTQQARRAATAPVASAPATSQSATGGATQQRAVLDENRVESLNAILKSEPNYADSAVQLGNTYFDAERWDDAIKWYERALEIDPNNLKALALAGTAAAVVFLARI